MNIRGQLVGGALWTVVAAIASICLLVFAVNESFDSVLDLFEQAQLVGFIIIALLLFVLVNGSIMARRLSRPIEELAQFVGTMNRGKLSGPVPYTASKGAVGELARAVEGLSERHTAELSASVESAQLSKRELMASNYRIQEVNRALEQAKLVNAESQELIQELEVIDEPTGLHNRRNFERVLDYELKRGQRSGRALSAVIFELANWRDIKAGLGQPTADAVLKQIADTMVSTVRSTDFAARYSDSALVLLLPETDGKNAAKLADSIHKLVATIDWAISPKDFVPLVGVGLASTDAVLDGESTIFSRLEAAVQKSLSSGGEAIEVA